MISLWERKADPPSLRRKSGISQRRTGRQIIRDRAAKVLGQALPCPNDAAEARGLGSCQLMQQGNFTPQGRPVCYFSVRLKPGHKAVNFHAMSYHVTWCAAQGRPPPSVIGLAFSHLCHDKTCVEAAHGVWEDMRTNQSRRACVTAGSCICKQEPMCIM